jgi:hypothetical protein
MAVINRFTRLNNSHGEIFISKFCNGSCEKRCFWYVTYAAAEKKMMEEIASLNEGFYHFWDCDVKNAYLVLVKVHDKVLAVFA